MFMFKMPKVVIERVVCIRRNFLWEGLGDKKKLHLMRWSELIKPKWRGGLSLGNLERKGALLAKWWRRFGEEREALWRRVIIAKYGVNK